MKQKIAEWLNAIFGFRKFILMLIIFVIGTYFRLHDLINGAEFVDLLKTTSIAFIGANGVEHVVGAVKDYMGANRPVQVADTDESNDEKEASDIVPN